MAVSTETGLLQFSGVPEVISPENPPIPEAVVEAHAIQVDRNISLGFHEELGLSETEYRASLALPGLVIPSGFPDIFTPVIVENRLGIGALHKRLVPQIYDPVPSRRYQDIISVPERPYLIWVDNGLRYARFGPSRAQRNFQPDESPLTFHELFAFREHHPEFYLHKDGVPERAFVAMGTRAVSRETGRLINDSAPDIRHFVVAEPFSSIGSIDHYVSGWFTPSRSKEITILGA